MNFSMLIFLFSCVIGGKGLAEPSSDSGNSSVGGLAGLLAEAESLPVKYFQEVLLTGYARLESVETFHDGRLNVSVKDFHPEEDWLMFEESRESEVGLTDENSYESKLINSVFGVQDARSFELHGAWPPEYCGLDWMSAAVGDFLSVAGKECNGVKLPDVGGKTNFTVVVKGDILQYLDSEEEIFNELQRLPAR